MYLSEITLRDEYAAKLMPKDCYGWHKIIWQFFPCNGERDFLYRVDSIPGCLRIYIVSGTRPHVPARLPQGICRTKGIPESFLGHSDYRFKLRANPTRRIKTDIRTGRHLENGMRAPITDLHDLAAWLGRKGAQSGFSIPGLQNWPHTACPLIITPEGRENFRKPGLDKAHHASVQFTGILHVEDHGLFRSSFLKGIGSAKAFGFGLLMLQPVKL